MEQISAQPTHTEIAQGSFKPSARTAHRTTMHHALHHSCLVSDFTIFILLYHAHVSSPPALDHAFITKNSIWEIRRYLPSLLQYK